MSATLVLVRHGATEWSTARRHTGRTDIPLTEEGRAQAEALRPLLAGLRPDRVRSSPLTRASDTCRLAGFGDRATTDDRLLEWDYGAAEGRTTVEIRAERDPAWSVWTHPIADAEPLASVATRVDQLIAELTAAGGVSLLFAHAHVLRVLAARWCALAPIDAQHLVLDPASVSVLGWERETPVIERWNVVANPFR